MSVQRRKAAKEFSETWANRGYEKGESATFWLELLRNVYGVENVGSYITFEKQVKLDHTSFIDAHIPTTHVFIEQKSIDKDLLAPIKQSNGELLTPFQQAKRYSLEIPYSKRPRWIITCNFQEFHVYDMEKPKEEPEVIYLKNLEEDYYRLNFLVDIEDDNVIKQEQISIRAGDIIGDLYRAFLREYNNPEDESTLHSLNVLCVRVVFCLYAEDAGLFGHRNKFHNYLSEYNDRDARYAIINLFNILNTPEDERDPYLDDVLASFPYVNGGLFADSRIEIPRLNDEILDIIVNRASRNFDWSKISPTIFGSLFESTLNPDTRASSGMHYTSIENIHKVIDPLFLNDIANEFERVKGFKSDSARTRGLKELQNKIANLKFLDPASGSGNFLTETYISLRRIENQIIRLLQKDKQIVMDVFDNPIKVSINQFYGIEINDFAVSVSKTALWIAESQMLKETEDIMQSTIDFLPLAGDIHVHQGNALTMDWNNVVPNTEINFIMGNPPFLGGMLMTKEQKNEIRDLFKGVKNAGRFDYVCGWYIKAIDYIKNNDVESAFVSTSSISQGDHVITFWKHLFESYNIEITFAHLPFLWSSEAEQTASVNCVIVGFHYIKNKSLKTKNVYLNSSDYLTVDNISPYLTDSETVFIENRTNPISNVPEMKFGSMPRDGGNLVLTPSEKTEFIKNEPITGNWIRPYIGAREMLNGIERYCLWLVDVEPSELRESRQVMDRIQRVKEFRLDSIAEGTRKFAKTPALFAQIAQPKSRYLMVPKTSSSRRYYLPMEFHNSDVIASDLVFIIPNANHFHFGILSSKVHMAWMRAVAGRLKEDYRYSKNIVYNNFPWPKVTDKSKFMIEKTGHQILEAREKHSSSTLADLYDDLTMPKDLLKAHENNDKAVMKAYGFGKSMTESEIVNELMKLYVEYIK